MTSQDPRPILAEALRLDGSDDHVELRYHAKRTRSVAVEKGRVDQAKLSEHTGVGVRVLSSGTYGFASTDRLDVPSVRTAIETTVEMAVETAGRPTVRHRMVRHFSYRRFDSPNVRQF